MARVELLGLPAYVGQHVVLSDGGSAHLKVVQRPLPNYRRFCRGKLTSEELRTQDASFVVRRYTSGGGWFCSKVNLALASDHSQDLQAHGGFVRRLKHSIAQLGHDWRGGPLFRGLDLSDIELAEMRRLRRFFIPSFTSASKDLNKAFSKRSTLLVIDASEAPYVLEVARELSAYDEAEVLLSCYSVFELKRVDLTCAPRRVYVKVLRQEGVEPVQYVVPRARGAPGDVVLRGGAV